MNPNKWSGIKKVTAEVQMARAMLAEVIDLWDREHEEGMPDMSELETVFELLSQSVARLINVLCDVSLKEVKP